MSSKLTGECWELDIERPKMYVLLCLADHAKEDGSDVYPSVERISWKTSYSVRQVQAIMRALEKDGVLILVGDRLGGKGKSAEYRIDISRAPKKIPFKLKDEKTSPLSNSNGAVSSANGAVSSANGAVSSANGAVSSANGAVATAPESNNQKQSLRESLSTGTMLEGFSVPDWIPIESWNGFVEMRKKIRKPLTERAMQLAAKQLKKLSSEGHDPEEVLDQSTMNSWLGLFPVKNSVHTNVSHETLDNDDPEWEVAARESAKRRAEEKKQFES